MSSTRRSRHQPLSGQAGARPARTPNSLIQPWKPGVATPGHHPIPSPRDSGAGERGRRALSRGEPLSRRASRVGLSEGVQKLGAVLGDEDRSRPWARARCPLPRRGISPSPRGPSPRGRGADFASDHRDSCHPSPFGRGVGGEEDLLLRGTGHRVAATGHHLLEPQSQNTDL